MSKENDDKQDREYEEWVCTNLVAGVDYPLRVIDGLRQRAAIRERAAKEKDA